MQKLPNKDVPTALWSRIENTLLEKETVTSTPVFKLSDFLFKPKTTLAFASVIACLIFANIQVKEYQMKADVNNYLNDHIISATMSDLDLDYDDFDSSVFEII